VGCFTGVRVPSMADVEGASMPPGLKAPGTREMKREGVV
jgi:hypothetical protein